MQATKKNYTTPLILIGILFFIFGFITWSNSQLIPYLKIACELTDTESYLVATSFFAAYFVMAIPSSMVLQKTGFKNGMSVGLLVMAVGAIMFVPAAQARSYPFFLSALFVIGSGLALLQTASNPYVTVLGPIESAAKRISIMGICNKIAGILAVYVLGSITLSNVDALKEKLMILSPEEKVVELTALASKVITPYIIIAVVLAALAVAFYFIHLPDIEQEEDKSSSNEINSKTSVFQFPNLVLGVVAIFLYVGVEVISYDTFSSFGEALGFTLQTSKNFASYTGYGLLAGYLLSIVAIPTYISQQKALKIATILSIMMVLIAMFAKGNVAVACFALLGFTNSVMWPAIWPIAIHGLGRFIKTGSALLIMGILGGAVLPPLYGKFAEIIGDKQMAYGIMIPCYLFILYYASKAAKQNLGTKG